MIVRPALKAGLLPLWRDRDTLQLGVDPRRAVALGGIGRTAAVITLLDGSRDRSAVIATGSTPLWPPVPGLDSRLCVDSTGLLAVQEVPRRLVILGGMKLALIGVAVGLAGSYGITRVLSTLLFGVKAVDPATFGCASISVLPLASVTRATRYGLSR